jgi:ATPase family associated with various cellular activities (AAA)
MNIMIGDTIVTDEREIGIVENRAGRILTVRFPDHGNRRDQVHQSRANPLAELIYKARAEGKPLRLGSLRLETNISLVGESTLAELVTLFGYSTGQMRRESLEKVLRQLVRAGLEIESETDRWGRDDKFKISLTSDPPPQETDQDGNVDTPKPTVQVTMTTHLPDPFWPTALGLNRGRELVFLRALTEADPILCLLYVPTENQVQTWIQGTWEGITSLAFRAAQRFNWSAGKSSPETQVRVGTSALLHTYLKPSTLHEDTPSLHDEPRSLNLITIGRESELPTDFSRLRAVWPGQIFEFTPDYRGEPSTDIQSINNCLSLVAGMATGTSIQKSPLTTLNWAKTANAQLMANATVGWGRVLSSTLIPSFKGSNECAATLALKAHLAAWIKRVHGDDAFQFECTDEDEDEACDDEDESTLPPKRKRIDLRVEGMGDFEVESMIGSGPMESFYHKKTVGRVRSGKPFWLIVPNSAFLWAGPYLSDLALHLGAENGVFVPSADGSLVRIAAKPLPYTSVEPMVSENVTETEDAVPKSSESPVQLQDVAGYEDVRRLINELIIWPEKNRNVFRPTSRSSGILFFGPPGCGKSLWARAIAGQLEQEVRLLGPSDLSGPYIGWGQIKIREQFDWLAENDKRMLIIDEFDAVARSRHVGQMHSDEKSCVNELLVQIDRVSRLGRLLAATTNFIGALDEAVVRSGRFGQFIPIPPPDLHESVEILAFYLDRLDKLAGRESTLKVHIPERSSLEAVVEPLYKENLENEMFFCGADIEVAVNRAYLRSARSALGDAGWNNESGVTDFPLTHDELTRSLIESPRSVQKESLQQFIEDVRRFCDRGIEASISKRLRSTS